ncbi:hypothetical protein PFISCL1PPCAC_8679 [Pristionchus fissidentatus]|uniref:SXP/RAL-2 family protein Ani s 5-like cation-binding domain-containing protein n=1 Tax=Pristionchus fissidentatus TaxID=1538716 RepID=A0AAV5VGY0_9BILA|nr:hypothetical protein PFISCL1PPCAC_8679 [Pristionchus fissidentatus]
MLSNVSLLLLIGLAALTTARYSSEEYGGRHEERRSGGPRPWYFRRLFGRHHGGPGAPWMPPHGPHGPHRRDSEFSGPPPPPFLKEATEEARKEFFQIFENANQTRAQTKERIQEWASKQSQTIQDGVIAFERNLTLSREAARENATAVIEQLQTALDRFTAVLESDNLTQGETMEKMKNTARSFDRDVLFAVKMIMRNARFRTAPKFFPRPEHSGPFGGIEINDRILPQGLPFPPPPPHGPMPPPPPPFGPEGPIDPFFPPPSPNGEENNAEDMGLFLPGDF